MNESVVGMNQVEIWEGFEGMSLFSLTRSQRYLSSDPCQQHLQDLSVHLLDDEGYETVPQPSWWPKHVKVCARNPKKTSITTLWEEYNLLFLDLPSPLVGFSSFFSCHVQVWFRMSRSCIRSFKPDPSVGFWILPQILTDWIPCLSSDGLVTGTQLPCFVSAILLLLACVYYSKRY